MLRGPVFIDQMPLGMESAEWVQRYEREIKRLRKENALLLLSRMRVVAQREAGKVCDEDATWYHVWYCIRDEDRPVYVGDMEKPLVECLVGMLVDQLREQRATEEER